MSKESQASQSPEDVSAEEEGSPSSTDQNDLHELVRELRAEVTRLKAQQAKARAKNWIQRHPLLTMVLSVGIGGAAGYGAAAAFHPHPPRTLSGHARQRLQGLTKDARELASRLRGQLEDRAARSSAQLRERAQETGHRLAEEAQEAGETAQREAQSFARTASERLRDATDEASRRFREGTEKAGRDARDVREALEDRASDVVDEYGGAVSDSVSEGTEAGGGRTFIQSLLTLAGIAAGGYLASRVRRWG